MRSWLTRWRRILSVIDLLEKPAASTPNAATTHATAARPKRQSKTKSSTTIATGAVNAAAMSGSEWARNPSMAPTLSSMTFPTRPAPSASSRPSGMRPRCSTIWSLRLYSASKAAECAQRSAAR